MLDNYEFGPKVGAKHELQVGPKFLTINAIGLVSLCLAA